MTSVLSVGTEGCTAAGQLGVEPGAVMGDLAVHAVLPSLREYFLHNVERFNRLIQTYHCTSFTPAVVSNEYCLAVLDVGEGTSLIKLQRKGNLSSDAESFNSTHHASSLVSHAPRTDHVLGDGLGHGGPALRRPHHAHLHAAEVARGPVGTSHTPAVDSGS